ncbi:MAG: DMT family transporter [Synechococcales cyanobacterium C42_A2020_086]|jgi:drug/metabolite transporter (DMT)-like permease|nr:DMT family transporter [Synechococcales cyanobacterium C42_A2020_086]
MKQVTPPSWQIASIIGVGILAISTSAILVRLATETTQDDSVGFSLVIAASRLTIAALLLAPQWQAFQTPPSGAVKYSVAAGLMLAIHFATWISSLSYTSITASTTLVTTNPIWVALISWVWFKESLSRRMMVGIAMALVGGMFIGSTQPSDVASNPLLGNSLALIGAWTSSCYLLLGREAQRASFSIGHHVFIAYSVAAVILLPLPLLAGASYTGYPALTYLWFGLMALIPQLIGHTSFNWAVRYLSPTLVTLAILMEPIGASILGYLLFQELPSLKTLIGAAILLAGVATAVLNVSAASQS